MARVEFVPADLAAADDEVVRVLDDLRAARRVVQDDTLEDVHERAVADREPAGDEAAAPSVAMASISSISASDAPGGYSAATVLNGASRSARRSLRFSCQTPAHTLA